MAVSIVKKLERCERLGKATRQGDAYAHNYHMITYKIQIKDYFSPNQIKLLNDTLAHPSNYEEPKSLPTPCNESTAPCLPCIELQSLILHEPGDSMDAPCSPSPPPSPPYDDLPQINLHEQEDPTALQNLQNYRESAQYSWKLLQENVLKDELEHVSSKTSLQAILPQPLTLQPNTVQEINEEASCARPSLTLQLERSNEQEEEINWRPQSSPNLQQIVKEGEEDLSLPWKLQNAIVKETEEGKLESEEDGRGGARWQPWKVQKEGQQAEKAGGGVWERVKKMECECCGMEEECTRGYEEKVRAGLRGHWLCGLCEEAVGEERKRVGGSVQAALAAHMQPCRRFSRRARSKASPSPSDVALPHAVCRLLCRHLSTPARRPASPSVSPALSRSPSLPN